MREDWLHKEVSKRLNDTLYDCNGFMTALLLLLARTLPVEIQTERHDTPSLLHTSFEDGTRVHQDIFERFIFRNVFRIRPLNLLDPFIFDLLFCKTKEEPFYH